jgi:signal transduction histidine kinase/ActR/RegA family two-component response regulator
VRRDVGASAWERSVAEPDGSAGGRDGVIRWLRILLVATVAIPVLLFIVASAIDYRAQFASARARLRRIAFIVDDNADKALETHELILRQVNALIAGASDADIAARQATLHIRLQDLIATVPQVPDVSIVGRDGRLLVDATTYPVPRDFDMSDRAYFVAERQRAQKYITPVRRGRLTGLYHFAIVERRSTPEGGFAGLTIVAVDPAYFREFYAHLLESTADRGSSIVLSRAAGDVLVHAPPGAGPERTSAAFRRHAAAASEGVFESAPSGPDGGTRLVAFHEVGDYPLDVAIAIPRADVIDDWIVTMAPHLLFGIPATILLFVLTLLALRRTVAAAAEHERRIAAETALNHAQRLEAMGRLTGGVAHDFNNLLTAILGNIEIAQMRVRDAGVLRVLDGAARAAERGARLVESLLAFARRQRLTTETVDANALVRDFTNLVRRTLPETIAIELALAPAPLFCRADAAQLEAALLNLVINARDAMAESGGTVTFTTAERTLTAGDLADNVEARPGAFVTIAVADNGSGMEPAVRERAFEPFFTTKDIGKGSGLGLSQVYGFVRQLGGHVTLDSAPGRGTTVRLHLPAAAAPLPERADAAKADAARPGATVLVVEDDSDVREVARDTLRAAGFAVVTADTANAAASLLESGARVDLLLSDVVMPGGMSGTALARFARRLRPDLPVLLMSGHTGESLEAHAPGEGEFALINKPFRHNDLVQRIAEALKHGRRERGHVVLSDVGEHGRRE